MKFKLVLLSLLFSANIQVSNARSPAVLPMVEIVPEREIQKDMKNAKGFDFNKNRPEEVKASKEEAPQYMTDGLAFFLTLLLPGALAWIIMRKAHNLPIERGDVPDNVIPLRKEEKDDISKAS